MDSLTHCRNHSYSSKVTSLDKIDITDDARANIPVSLDLVSPNATSYNKTKTNKRQKEQKEDK